MPRQRFLHNRLSRRLDVLIRGRLWLQVIVALVLGVSTGLLIGPDLNVVDRDVAELIGRWFALPGRLFIAAIRMVIIPLAASSIVLGVTGAGGGETLKSIGRRMGLFVLVTTLLGAFVGAFLATAAHSGASAQASPVQARAPSIKPDPDSSPEASPLPIEALTRDLPDLITGLIPQNIAASVLEQDMLAIVVFSLFVGIAVVSADKRALTAPLVGLAEAVLEVSMTVIRTAMRFAPVAVFGLMTETTASNGVATLADLAIYCGVVLAGLAVLLLVYLVAVLLLGGMSPAAFLKAAGPVQLLAFSTSSSAAVMPLTMKTAVEKLGTPPAIAGAVVPLASTVNMAGTALYQAAAVVFLANTGGEHLTSSELMLIMITLTGASIGAPAAPGASIAILSATAANFGIPLAGLPLVIGVDRLLDMARTSVNVTGDLVLCRILSGRGAAAAVQASDAELSGEPTGRQSASDRP